MTEKELIKKLNNLQNFQPDAEYLKSNREILFAQISNSSNSYNPGPFETFMMNFRNIMSGVYQPVLVMAMIVLFLGSGLIFGHNFINVNPNNSLYIAKVISEQARLGFVFDESAKEKMASDFAASHAQSIVATLSSDTDINTEELNKLSDSFKNEVNVLKQSAKKPAAVKASVAATSSNNDDAIVSIANSDAKVESGISIFNPNDTTNQICSSTNTALDPTLMLDEAEALFDAKDYDGAANKLKAANEVLNK